MEEENEEAKRNKIQVRDDRKGEWNWAKTGRCFRKMGS